MPKVITQDDIDKIAEYAGRSYTKAATARELKLDRTTVRKYWPSEQKPEEEKAKQPTPQLSLEEGFELRTKKKETELKLENLQIKLEDTDGETQDLEARREVALEQIKVLGEKLDGAESVIEVDKVQELAAKVKDEVTALLEQIEPLRKQREEQQEKERQEREDEEKEKRQEDIVRSDRIERNLRAVSLSSFAWIFPCSREQAEKIVNRFLWKVSDNVDDPIISSLHVVNKQLSIAQELKWEDDTTELNPLINECVNLLDGNGEEKQRIVNIMHARKERILIPSDEDMRKKFIDLLSAETNEKFVKMALKLNAAFGHLAEERFIDKEDLLSKETPEPVVG
ncbi:hypothetical protein ES703_40807 [subsurface metagenome]